MITVINEHITIRRIIEGCSIARFGDGEFKLCAGKNQISQPHTLRIQRRLLEVLRSDINFLLVGVPRIYKEVDFDELPEKKKQYWDKYRKSKRWKSLPLQNRIYYSAFISRPDSTPCIDNDEYYNFVKEIWDNRHILIVEGKGHFGKNEKLIDNAKSVERFKAPVVNAFKNYDQILKSIIKKAKGDNHYKLILLSLGPTATILAHDLHLKGFQAIDVGHMSMFHAQTHPKSKEYKGNPEVDADERYDYANHGRV